MNAANEGARKLVQEIRNWAAGFAGGSFYLTETLHPDDEYGSYAVLAFEPTNPRACPLELIVVAPEPVGTGILLDSWGRLQANHEMGAAALRGRAAWYTVLFLEPRELPVERVLAVCDAVSRGRVIVAAGIAFGKLSATGGGVQLESGLFRMDSITNLPFPCIRLLARFGLGEVKTVPYEPWF